jgi:hypothetical protein
LAKDRGHAQEAVRELTPRAPGSRKKRRTKTLVTLLSNQLRVKTVQQTPNKSSINLVTSSTHKTLVALLSNRLRVKTAQQTPSKSTNYEIAIPMAHKARPISKMTTLTKT